MTHSCSKTFHVVEHVGFAPPGNLLTPPGGRAAPVKNHWSRRTTQNMSATRNSPTISLNLRALPLSAVTVSTVSLDYLPRRETSAVNRNMRQNAYHRNLKCIFEDLLPCYCYATEAIVEQFAPKFRNLPLQPVGKERTWVSCKLITRPVTRGCEAPLENLSPPLEKYVGHILKVLNIV